MNPNDPNSSNPFGNANPTPASPFPTPPEPVAPANPAPTPADPAANFTPSPSLAPQPDFPSPQVSMTPPPAEPNPSWPTTPPAPQPNEAPSLSPLDNPWGAPVQTPVIDGASQNLGTLETPAPTPIESVPTPTFEAPAPTPEPSQPSWAPSSTPEPTTPEPAIQADSAPTDLSHLISNNNSNLENPTQMAPETLVVPSNPTTGPEVSVPTEAHKGIPKWVIGVGIGLILIVAAASAYFILGVGQPTQTTSLPATVSENPTSSRAPVPTPIATTAPVATGSADFGDIEGSGNTGQTATSAADLIRQRQQGL